MAPDVKMEVMLVRRWCGGGQGGIWEVWEGGGGEPNDVESQ